MSDDDLSPGMSTQAIADLAIGKLRESDGAEPGDGTEQELPDNQPGDDAPDESPPSVEDAAPADPEPPAPSVEPPASWTAAEKEAFATLPPDKQRTIADRERERTLTIRRSQDEAAAARKEREAIAAERQQTAAKFDFLIQQAQLADPILAEGARTDWAKLAKDSPAEYVARKAEYDQRVGVLNHIAAERDRLEAQSIHEAKTKMVETLRSDDELGLRDQAKWDAFNQGLSQYLVAQGYAPEGIQRTTDAKLIKTAWKAMQYDKIMADRKAAETKKQAPTAKRVITPNGSEDGSRNVPARLDAAAQAAIRSGSARKQADAALAILRANRSP